MDQHSPKGGQYPQKIKSAWILRCLAFSGRGISDGVGLRESSQRFKPERGKRRDHPDKDAEPDNSLILEDFPIFIFRVIRLRVVFSLNMENLDPANGWIENPETAD